MFESLIWVIPAAVAGFGLWRPRAGLLVFAACLPFFGSPPGGPYLAALDVSALAAILTAWRGGAARSSALTWPAAAFVAVSLVSLVPSPYQPPSWNPEILVGLVGALPGVESWPALFAWRAAIDLLLGWGLFLAVRRAWSGETPGTLAAAILAGLVAVVVLGLANRYGLVDLAGYRPQFGSVSRGRLQSLFFLSGWASEFLIVATPFALAALAAAGDSKKWVRRLALPVFVLACLSLTLTQQRGGLIALGAQILLAALLLGRRWRQTPRSLVRVGAALSLAATLTVTGLVVTGSWDRSVERFGSMASGIEARVPLWRTAGAMTRERPVLGWGLGTFDSAFALRHPPGSEGAPRFHATAHNLYLHLAAERGLLGLAAFGLLGVAAWAGLARPRPGAEHLALGLALSLAGAAVYGLVQYMMFIRSIHWLLWILLAAAALVAREEERPWAARAAQAAALLCALLLPIRLLTHEAPRLAGNRAYGLHKEEVTPDRVYRWTEGLAAQRLSGAGELLFLRLANGHPSGGARPVTVTVGVDGEPLAELVIEGGWEEHRLELPASTAETFVVTLEASPTFRPFSEFRGLEGVRQSTDIRQLGVAVEALRVEK